MAKYSQQFSEAMRLACVWVRLTHDGLVGVGVAYRIRPRDEPSARQLGCSSILNLYM